MVAEKFEDEDGNFDKNELAAFVKKYIPRKDDWNTIKNRVIVENEKVKFLAKIAVNIDIKTGLVSFALPDFGLGFKETIIENSVWDICKDDLVKGRDIWGMVELGYRAPDDFDVQFEYERTKSKAKASKDGKIKLVSFKTSALIILTSIIIRKHVRSSMLKNGSTLFLARLIIMQEDMKQKNRS